MYVRHGVVTTKPITVRIKEFFLAIINLILLFFQMIFTSAPISTHMWQHQSEAEHRRQNGGRFPSTRYSPDDDSGSGSDQRRGGGGGGNGGGGAPSGSNIHTVPKPALKSGTCVVDLDHLLFLRASKNFGFNNSLSVFVFF